MLRLIPLLAGCALSALLAPALTAQACQDPGDTKWVNDTLNPNAAPNSGSPAGSKVLIALCNDEAAGSVFTLPPGSPPQHIKQVAIGYGHVLGTQTFMAVTNIEIYEGPVGWNAGSTVTMGTKIFDLQADAGITFDITSSGLSTFDLSPYNVVVHDDFVVAFRMVSNVSFPGCPAAVIGSAANFLTDSVGCNPQINVLDERTVGWVDPATWMFSPLQTICPTFYSGNWVIRACTTDAGTWTDVGNSLAGTLGDPALEGLGPLTAGSLNPLTLSNTLPSVGTYLVIGFTGIFAPLKGGVLVPSPDFLFAGIPTGPGGSWTLASPWPAGIPSGFELFWQAWIPDAAGPISLAASNGVISSTP